MAQRSRKYSIQYGGEFCGGSNTGNKFVPAYVGTHSCIDETHPGPPYRSGGPLSVSKKKVQIFRSSGLYSFYHSTLGWYDGFMGVTPYIPSPEPSFLNLSGWGAKGYSRTMPLHPIYQLGVSLVELKDVPHMLTQTLHGLKALGSLENALKGISSVRELLRRFRSIPRDTGDTYLYGAFGVAPMLQDLLFLFQMREKLDKKISWLRRHNGKPVRRKITLDTGGFSENVARNLAPSSTCFPVLSSFLYAPGMSVSQPFPVLKTYQRRIWFAAKYRFYIPELAKDPRIAPPSGGLVRDLLGLSPDPSVVYKATPWSWLLDWFTSVGDVISNIYLRAKYQVVAEYAYVMASETFTYAAPGYVEVNLGTYNLGWKNGTRKVSGVSRTIYEFRQREVANPYGFGVTYASLSAYQWSILAALGLSRGSKSSAPRT